MLGDCLKGNSQPESVHETSTLFGSIRSQKGDVEIIWVAYRGAGGIPHAYALLVTIAGCNIHP